MKLPYSGVVAYRYFSTKRTNFSRNSYKKKNQEEHYDPTKPKQAKIKWTDQQKEVLSAISSGQSVFISGSAGTGKTRLVRHIIKQLKKMYTPSNVFVTASTGVAACSIQGQTLHSFAGVGLGAGNREYLLSKVISNKSAYRRWTKVEALVVDEISMIDAEFIDGLEYIAREIRKVDGSEDLRWGGIHLVMSGDFFQLPPVTATSYRNRKSLKKKEFAFEADCWDSSFDMQVELTTIFRQSETLLVKLLQGIRRGESDPEELELLENLFCGTEPDSSVVRIYPRNKDVCNVNMKHLESLGEEIIEYQAVDTGVGRWKMQLKQGIAPDELKLCRGARVMLIKNIKPWLKLVNGATGTVVDFKENFLDDGYSMLPIVDFDSGPKQVIIEWDKWDVVDGEKVVATRRQIPLVLAWALSIHKCQGMTLETLQTDLSQAFGFGMVYVALSRVKSLNGLHISGFDRSKIKAHPKVSKFYERFVVKQDEDEVDNKIVNSKSNLPDVSDIHYKRRNKIL